MKIDTTPCREMPLDLLLSDVESGAEDGSIISAMTEHVAHCATCQSRLTELAADATCWNEVRESLSDAADHAWKPDASWSSHAGLPSAQKRGENVDSLAGMVRQFLAAPSHPELLGRLGRYDIERVIGAGGMGIVLKAHDSELNRPIAVKVLASHLAHVGAARERFAREGRAAAAVVHEHVVAIYNVESDGVMPFLVMQYVPGRSLQARVDDEGPLAVEEILRIGMQAASGLAAAHAQGLVHRDVKPANILLEETVERAVLTDFGLARTIDDASLTHTGVLAGTPHYMSPEQATGEAIDHRSDLFSLGAVLYFMATGRPPFRAEGAFAVLHRICNDEHRPVWQANPEIPDELSDLIDQLLAKKPNRRPATAAETSRQLAAQLSHFQQFGPSRRKWAGWRGRRGQRRVLGAVAAVLAVILAVTTYQFTSSPTTIEASPNTETNQAETSQAELRQSVEQAIVLESNFTSDLGAAHQAVGEAEGQTTYSATGEDAWSRELEAIDRELQAIESEPIVNP
jgi:eukaryotic-like serine/threonine-protein kinase